MSYFEQRSPRKARQIGYGSYFDSEPALDQTTLTDEQRESLLESIGGQTMQAAEGLFSILDTPASYGRDLLAGRALGSGTTPGELLDSYGIRPNQDALGGWARPAAEFLTGAVLDPLNLVPFGGLSKAGAALKARTALTGVNALEDATRVMGRRMIQAGDTGGWTAQSALKTWKSLGKDAADLTDADLLARPIVGPRQTGRTLTLDEYVKAQPNSQQLVQEIEDWLPKNGGGTYQDIANQTLTKDIGLSLPFSDRALVGFNLPGGGATAKALDRTLQGIRWSAPIRHAYAAFDRDAFGATDEIGQIVGKEVANAARQGEALGKFKATDRLQDLNTDVLIGDQSSKLGEAMRRVMSGTAEASDLQLVQSRPDLQKFVDDWTGTGTTPGMAQDYLARRAAAGMASAPFRSRYGTGYFPRHVDDLSFLAKIEEQGLTGGAKKGRAFSGNTPDQMARARYLDVPGGNDVVNRLSLDPNLAGPERVIKDELSAARYIKKEIEKEIAQRFQQVKLPNGRTGYVLPNGQPVPAYSLASAKKMARTLAQIDARAVQNKLPMFGSHVTDDFIRYVQGNERGMAVNNVIFDLLGSTAKNVRADMVAEGGHVTMRNALKRLGLRTTTTATPGASMIPMKVGAEPEVLRRLAKRFPGGVPDLKNVSLDRRMLDRLGRIADFYDYPEVQGKWLKFFDGLTRVWKASILSWPARFTRDWYSGGFSNLVEVGSIRDLMTGYQGAKHLIQGDWASLEGVLAQVPRYAKMSASSRKREFINDLASGGLLGGRRATDLADAMNTLQTGANVADTFLPGSAPRTTLGYQAQDVLRGRKPLGADKAAYSELYKGENWKRFGDMGLLNARDVGNPVMKWGAQLGDTTDTINRTSGYIGLLLQGIDPMEAARRIKLSHVDYQSLTKLERETFRRFLPFWSFSSRIGRWVGEKLWEKPGGRFTQFGLRAPNALLTQEEGEYVPDSIKRSYGMPVSASIANPFGGGKQGVTPWLNDIALPGIGEINMASLGFKPDGRIDLSQTMYNTGQDIISKMAHPYIKSTIEMATGQNLYTKRPAKEFKPALTQLAEDMLGVPANSVYGQYITNVAPALDLLPFVSRGMQITNRLLDSDKIPDFKDRAYQMGVNAFSGFKFQPVDDLSRIIDVRRKIGEIAQQDPLIRSISMPYIPKEAVPFADPRLVQMLALDRQLGRQLKNERDRRAGVPVKAKRRDTDPMGYFQ